MRSSIIFVVLFSLILSITFAAVVDIPVEGRTIARDLTVTKTVPVVDQERIISSSDLIRSDSVNSFAFLEPIAVETPSVEGTQPVVVKEPTFVEKSGVFTPATTDVVEPIVIKDDLFVTKSDLVQPILKEPVVVDKSGFITPVTTDASIPTVVKGDFFAEKTDIVQPLFRERVVVDKSGVVTPVATDVSVPTVVNVPSVVKGDFFVERSALVQPIFKDGVAIDKSDLLRSSHLDGVIVEKSDIVTPVTSETTTTSSILKDNLFVEGSFKRPIVREGVIVEGSDVVTPLTTKVAPFTTEVTRPVVFSDDVVSKGNRFFLVSGAAPVVASPAVESPTVAPTKIITRPILVERVSTSLGSGISTSSTGSTIVRRFPLRG